ncbi:MAG TPA: hypothetical protein VMV79_05990, partial [Alphaproteobacteria bacterium]|nr:hypothetical protein [Alphaproteobacteria bacterium]
MTIKRGALPATGWAWTTLKHMAGYPFLALASPYITYWLFKNLSASSYYAARAIRADNRARRNAANALVRPRTPLELAQERCDRWVTRANIAARPVGHLFRLAAFSALATAPIVTGTLASWDYVGTHKLDGILGNARLGWSVGALRADSISKGIEDGLGRAIKFVLPSSIENSSIFRDAEKVAKDTRDYIYPI